MMCNVRAVGHGRSDWGRTSGPLETSRNMPPRGRSDARTGMQRPIAEIYQKIEFHAYFPRNTASAGTFPAAPLALDVLASLPQADMGKTASGTLRGPLLGFPQTGFSGTEGAGTLIQLSGRTKAASGPPARCSARRPVPASCRSRPRDKRAAMFEPSGCGCQDAALLQSAGACHAASLQAGGAGGAARLPSRRAACAGEGIMDKVAACIPVTAPTSWRR